MNNGYSFLKKHWPLLIAMFLFLLTVSIILAVSIDINHGKLGYALDDAYIHMSIAKNMVEHGTWGINDYGFSSTTSSPLFTAILTIVFFIFGVNETVPLVLNIIIGMGIICLVYFFLKPKNINRGLLFLSLISIIFLTPMPAIIFSGMEHSLHLLLTISFVYFASRILSGANNLTGNSIPLLILAPFLTSVRYEGLFLLFVVVLLFLIKKRRRFSLLLAALGLAPLIIYGIVSSLNGSYFLPNSLLLKAMPGDYSILGMFKYYGATLLWQLYYNPHVTSLILVAAVGYACLHRKRKMFWEANKIMTMLFITVTIIHLTVAKLGWFFRYDAYICGLGLFVVFACLFQCMIENASPHKSKSVFKFYSAGLAGVLILHIFSGVYENNTSTRIISTFKTPLAIKNIHDQQYQMGLFCQKFYQGQCVAANDIGALSFLAESEILDLYGLANAEVVKAKMNRFYTTEKILELGKIHRAKIAIVYDMWYIMFGGLPQEWNKVAEWVNLNNVVCSKNNVAFYAVDTAETAKLIQNLDSFSASLPDEVVYKKFSPNQSGN